MGFSEIAQRFSEGIRGILSPKTDTAKPVKQNKGETSIFDDIKDSSKEKISTQDELDETNPVYEALRQAQDEADEAITKTVIAEPVNVMLFESTSEFDDLTKEVGNFILKDESGDTEEPHTEYLSAGFRDLDFKDIERRKYDPAKDGEGVKGLSCKNKDGQTTTIRPAEIQEYTNSKGETKKIPIYTRTQLEHYKELLGQGYEIVANKPASERQTDKPAQPAERPVDLMNEPSPEPMPEHSVVLPEDMEPLEP